MISKQRKIMYFLEALISIAGIAFLIINACGKKAPNLYGASISGIFIGIALVVVEMIFRYRFPIALHIIYFVYMVASNIIGSNLEIFTRTVWYDKVLHAILGYILCIVAVYIAIKTKIWERTLVGDIIIIFAISMAYASVWELIEWFADKFLNQSMQHGLQDTMLDIGSHFVLTVVFLVQFIISRLTKYGLGMNILTNSLSKDEGKMIKKDSTEIL